MGREEQAEEKETLQSIFPDELADVSEHTYRITVTLDIAGEEDEDDKTQLVLQVSYPEEYPDVAPHLELSAPPHAPKHPHIDVQEDRERLLELLQTTAEENLGMAMVFSLVDTLKEGAELLVAERQAAVQAARQVEAARADEEENRKFQGEKVTRESFMAWRERFRAEMRAAEEARAEEREAEERKKKSAGRDPRKLSGRQLWERGLVGKGDEEDLSEQLDRVEVA